MALSHCIVDSRLAILILPIKIFATERNEEVDQGDIALSGSVEDWLLLQGVFLLGVNAELNENFDHLKGKLLVPDDAGGEGKSLTEVFRLINDLTYVNARLSNDAHNLIDITSLYLLKQILVQRVLLVISRYTCDRSRVA